MASKHDGFRHFMLDTVGRFGLTLLIVFVLLVLSTFPVKLGGLGEVRPAFLLIATYYWAVNRPHMLPPLGAFFAGLALDLLSGLPLGMNALTLVAARSVTASQQKFLLAQNFMVMWACFALVSFCAALLQWAIYSLLVLEIVALQPVLVSAVLTTLIFPAVAWPLHAILRAVDDRSIFR